MFNVLHAMGDPVEGAQVLDLFAGTGALSLEALSRGAAAAVLVDNGRKACALIQKNIELTRMAERAKLLRKDATRLGPNSGEPATLVFLDPPYGKALGARALDAARTGGWIAPGATIVWEEAAEQSAPEGFQPLDARRYGNVHLSFLSYAT